MTKKGLVARPLKTENIPDWDRLVQKHGTVFDTRRWIDLFGPKATRVGIYDAGDNLRGGFCCFEQKRFGLKIIRNLPFTYHTGPFFESRSTNPAAMTHELRSIIEAVAAYLDSCKVAIVSISLPTGIDDCLPFRWRNYKVIPHYTYRLQLLQDNERLFSCFSNERRKNIRRADKDGVVADEVENVAEFQTLVADTFERQKKKPPWQLMKAILKEYPPGKSSYCIVSRDNGQPVAGVYIIYYRDTAYYLMGGYSQSSHHGAGALAMYQAILRAKSLGLEVFDFEGSVIQPIERYLRGFGGRLTPLFSVNKACLPLEMVLKLAKRQLF